MKSIVKYAACSVCQKLYKAELTPLLGWRMEQHPPVYIEPTNWVPNHDGSCEGSFTTPQWVDHTDSQVQE